MLCTATNKNKVRGVEECVFDVNVKMINVTMTFASFLFVEGECVFVLSEAKPKMAKRDATCPLADIVKS